MSFANPFNGKPNKNKLENIATKEQSPSTKGRFGERSTYVLGKRTHNLNDFPTYVQKTLGFIIESYLQLTEIKNDNQR